jgi:hypothetical protein
MYSNTVGINNTAVGNGAFCANTIGSGNVAVGTGALASSVDASRAVAIGEGALLSATSGQYNTAIGWSALCNATGAASGSNVAIGALAGNNITTGNSNVAIGPNVTVPFGNQDCQLAIGYNLGQCWITGDSSKNVKFWAGIRANDDSLGSSGQVLTSTGSGVQWATPGGAKQYMYALVGTNGVNVVPNTTIPLTGISAGGGPFIQLNNVVLTVGNTYLLTASLTITAGSGPWIPRWVAGGLQIGPELYLGNINGTYSTSWIYTPTSGGNAAVQLQLGSGNATFRREGSTITVTQI